MIVTRHGERIGCHVARHVLLVCFWAVTTSCSENTSAPGKEAELDRWVKSGNGRFVVAGVVVDEQGNKLRGVRLKIEKGKATGAWKDLKFEEEEKTVNGKFALQCDGYMHLSLRFSHENYYPHTLDFSSSIPNMDEDQFAGRKKIPTPSLIKEDLRVILEKQGTIAYLADRTGILEWSTKGPCAVLNFDLAKEPFVTISRNFVRDQLPKNCAYIVPETNQAGTLATVTVKRMEKRGMAKREVEYEYPEKVRLIMSSPGAGVVKCDVKTRQGKTPFHQMKTAPENGYEQELVYDESCFNTLRPGIMSDDNWQYFYFKTKDRYGKGRIGFGYLRVEDFRRDTNAVRATVTFRIQSDGSRNLETED